MQQIPLAIRKKQNIPRSASRPNLFRKSHPALFQFRFGSCNRIDFQCQMTKSSQLVIAPLRQECLCFVNLKPNIAQGYQIGRWILAIVENSLRTENLFVPMFQGSWISGGNGNMFNGNVHGIIKNQLPDIQN